MSKLPKIKRSTAVSYAVGLALCWAGAAAALDVRFAAVDLPDTVIGVDAWRYDYTISGALDEATGFTLLYAHDAFANLMLAAPAPMSAFDGALAQPDPGLDGAGLFSLTAVRAVGAAESFTFSVRFDRLGAGAPGAQPFQTFAADFSITGTGVTSPVPEPSSYALLLCGTALLLARLSRRR